MAFVTGMRMAAPKVLPRLVNAVYGATIHDRGAGSTGGGQAALRREGCFAGASWVEKIGHFSNSQNLRLTKNYVVI